MDILGIQLDIQYVSYNVYWPYEQETITSQIIERIGRIEEFIYHPVCGIDAQPWETLLLRCYIDYDLSYKSDWWATWYPDVPCDSLIDGSTGINLNNQADQITIYPNPSQDLINIECTNSPVRNVEIYNTLGELIHGYDVYANFLQLDVKDLHAGFYYVIIYTENNVKSTMLIKQ